MDLRKIFIYGILFASTTVFAQPRISSNTERVNLNRIEWKRPVKVEYTITNTGDKPLVMNKVITSCACTVAEWTTDPIAPGQKGKVVATFDAQQLGRFEKDVCIYSNANPNLVYLTFGGEVVSQVNDVSSSHPFKIGNIAIDKTSIEFPDAHRGDQLTATLDIVNQSDRPYEPILMHLPSSITMKSSSNMLLKGQRGIIKLTLDTKQINDVGETNNSIYLSRFNGDKISPENEIPISVVILPDFSGMTASDKVKAPIIQLSDTVFDVTNDIKEKSKLTKEIVIGNKGLSPLVITKVQVFNSALGVSLKKRIIQPGETTSLKINIHSHSLKNDKNKTHILIICDDPVNPKKDINIITAKK
jgi:hypothetical protein